MGKKAREVADAIKDAPTTKKKAGSTRRTVLSAGIVLGTAAVSNSNNPPPELHLDIDYGNGGGNR